MADYTGLAEMARSMIADFGRTLRFCRREVSTSAEQPWRGTTNLPETVEAIGVVVDYDLTESTSQDIRRGDKQCFSMLPDGVESPEDFVMLEDSLDDSIWRIIRISPIQPGDTLVTYELQLRQ